MKAEGLHAYVDTIWISDINAQMVGGMESRGSTHLYGNVLYFWDTFSVTQIPVTLLIVTDVGWGGRFHAGCVDTSTIPVLHLTQRGDAVFFVTYVATKGVENRNFWLVGSHSLGPLEEYALTFVSPQSWRSASRGWLLDCIKLSFVKGCVRVCNHEPLLLKGGRRSARAHEHSQGLMQLGRVVDCSAP